jgi:beta-glucosidase
MPRNQQILTPLASVCVFLSASAFSQGLEARIDAIIATMTLGEKILQLNQEGSMNTQDNNRLGIPGFMMSDGPHGVRDGKATSFPVTIGMASTWDTELARRVGIGEGLEFLGKGKHQMLGTSMDLERDVRDGRSAETGGEDPFLCARITTALIAGAQSTGIIATAKHYNANFRENGRTTNDVFVMKRDLEEHYGLHFRSAVQEAGALCVMNAYTLVNGAKSAENRMLLTDILRDDWGFPFYVVSDWGAIWNSQKALLAGTDVCMGADNYKNDLASLVAGGQLSVATVDSAVKRVLRTKIVAGMLDRFPSGDPADVNSTAHQQLCLEAGRKSLVLLRNQGDILPLDPNTIGSLALIGPSASTAFPVDGSGSAYVTPYYTVNPRQGIESYVGPSKVFWAKGCDINSGDTSGFALAATYASLSDVVVYVGGLDGTQEGEGRDRVGGSIELPGKQQALINRLASVNPRLVVVLVSGGVCGLGSCNGSVPALIQAFYPGQEGGRAIADVLFGVVNPAGRLPVTWPASDAQLPAWNDDFTDDYGCGYRWFDQTGQKPLFAFGSGLSYTAFHYSNIRISSASIAPGQSVDVTFTLTNTGARPGDEVAQLYLTDSSSTVWMPAKQLKGFARIFLEAGASTDITLRLTPEEMSYYDDVASRFRIDPGQFVVKVGGASDALPLRGTFTVNGAAPLPDLRVTQVRTIPPVPAEGDSVQFVAFVKNGGAAATESGAAHKVVFRIDGVPVALATTLAGPLRAHGSGLAAADAGGMLPGGRWIAPAAGTYTLSAEVDPDNLDAEGDETNNQTSRALRVIPRPPANLALRKPATASSVEVYNGVPLAAANAFDGSLATRWSSQFGDPQTLTVDLQQVYHLTRVIIQWEYAFGKEYVVSVGKDTSSLAPVYYTTTGDGGVDTVALGVDGQFVRMTGIHRGTQYGYSIYEMAVQGSEITDVAPVREGPATFRLHDPYPNPFNPSTVIGYQLPFPSHVRLVLYDPLGREVAVLEDGERLSGLHSVTWNASGCASGVYLCRLTAGGFASVKKVLLVR